MPQTFVLPRQIALDDDANPLAGAFLYFFQTGTDTPQAVYSDAALQNPITQPVTADAAGEFAKIYLNTEASANYRVRLTTSDGVLLYQEDDIDRFTVTQAEIARAFYPRTSAEIAAEITPSNYVYPQGVFERYGAVGDGSVDDTTALQRAFLVGGDVKGTPGRTYRITASAYLTVSGTTADLRGCIINQVTAGTSWLIIGRTASSSTFVKTDRAKILGGKMTGAVAGGGAPAYGVSVIGPTTNPYVNGQGCDDIEIAGVSSSGFTGGFIASGASNIKIHHCTFGGMIYHIALGAGGYGALFQTCFDIIVDDNLFKATTTDRHAIYVSADSGRTFNNDNVCKNVVISNNVIDWSATAGASGFEAAIEIRSAERVVVDGNSIRGGYGGIEYDAENGNGVGVTITNNVVRDIVAGASQRNAITIVRSSGSYVTAGVVIANNTISFNDDNVNGIVVGNCVNAIVTDNIISIGEGIDAILFSNTTHVRVGGNIAHVGVGGSAGGGVAFFGTCSNISVGKNLFDGSLSPLYRYYANPTEIEFDFPRTATVSWSGGVATVDDPLDILSAAASDATGFTVTFQAWVTDITTANLAFTSASSNVCSVYRRSLASQVLTVGVTNYAGSDMPAASNDYSIAITLKS